MRLAASFVAVICLVPATASAYEPTRSSSGAALHWRAGNVELTLAYTPGPAAVTPADATAATHAAVATWQDALAGTALELRAAHTRGSAAAHDARDGSNVVRWAVHAGDPDVELGVLALTFVSYRVSDGAIRDADIVLNAVDAAWTTAGTPCWNAYDLESALAHELGHLLGLGHSVDRPDATMFATADTCEITKRDLSVDDRAALDALYGGSAGVEGGCSTSGSASGLALALCLGFAARRRVRTLVVAAAIALVTAPIAGATTLRPLAAAELARAATLTVRGRVVGAVAAADQPFASDTTLVVAECLAGDCPATVVVRTRGGEHGDTGLWVDGEAHLAIGTEVVLYLRRDARGHRRVLGGVQGAWVVAWSGGVAIARRDLRDHQLRIGDRWAPGTVEATPLDHLRHAARRARAR